MYEVCGNLAVCSATSRMQHALTCAVRVSTHASMLIPCNQQVFSEQHCLHDQPPQQRLSSNVLAPINAPTCLYFVSCGSGTWPAATSSCSTPTWSSMYTGLVSTWGGGGEGGGGNVAHNTFQHLQPCLFQPSTCWFSMEWVLPYLASVAFYHSNTSDCYTHSDTTQAQVLY